MRAALFFGDDRCDESDASGDAVGRENMLKWRSSSISRGRSSSSNNCGYTSKNE